MVWAQGQMKWAKVAQKYSTYKDTHKKSETQNQKFVFYCKLQDFLSLFECVNSSLAFTTPELCLRKATCEQAVFTQTT